MKDIKGLLTKNKLVLLGLSIFTVLLIIGTSFALYQIINQQTEENLVDVGCFNVSITKQENAINLENAYPISDEKGKSLTPFTFTLTNNCNVTGKYTVNLEVLKDSTMSTSFVKTLVNNGTISKLDALPKAETKNSGSIEARTLANGILTPNSSVDYSVSLWMDENVTIEDGAMNKILKSKIVVISKALSQITSDDPITKSIIAQLDTTGKCPRVNADGTMQLTDAETGSGYLCSAPDNYGLSYYYRGDVTNNYVQFGKWPDDTPDVVYGYDTPDDADTLPTYSVYSSMDECRNSSSYNNNCTLVSRKGKPMYWRILRINGDGTYRLIYDGTMGYENEQISYDRQPFNGVATKDFEQDESTSKIYQEILNSHDNAAVGYMHGDIDGIVESTQTDEVSMDSTSSIKVAKVYTFSDETGFHLTNPVTISQSSLSQDYVGYYFFAIGDSYNDATSTNLEIYKIDSITKEDSSTKITRKAITYGTQSKEQAQTNKNDSIYKKVMDNWYKTNLKDTKYEQYLVDNIFCNNRTISTDNLGMDRITNLGFGQELTLYGIGASYYQAMVKYVSDFSKNENIDINQFSLFITNFLKISLESINTSLICQQKNDSFTVNDSLYGNANLTYPIGELTADDIILAGGFFGKTNKNYFLHTGNIMGVMTPLFYPSSFSISSSTTSPLFKQVLSLLIANDGSLINNWLTNTNYYTSNPVINLSSGTLNSGNGTIDNPYIISDDNLSVRVKTEYYLNNEKMDKVPLSYEKGRYSVEKVECDNNTVGTWNIDKWELEASNITTNSVCKVYFKTPTVTIANNKMYIDALGKCPIANEDGSLLVTKKESSSGYLCKAKDAYGDSYYFRGTVDNNYVKFAGFYWRIVRINGDDTVRMIYDGTSAHSNGESSTDRQIGTCAFNNNYNDNAYVGYMYGTAGTSTYATTHANIKDSTIKTYIDNWYKANILGTDNEQYLADNVFCNDRSISSNIPSSNYSSDPKYNNYGYGTNPTAYRWAYGPWSSGGYNSNLMLKCPQQNDAFTVSDTTNGNGALTYPIGLMSMDEIVLAGGHSGSNRNYYLYIGFNNDWYSLSPDVFNGSESYMSLFVGDGTVDGTSMVKREMGVRPVLNLKANALNAGTGTADDPYRIS